MNSITTTPNPPVVPSAYLGYGEASKALPPILRLPNDVLNLIVREMIKQNTPVIPLRFVCKRIANLPALQAEKTTNEEEIRNRIYYAVQNALSQGSISLVTWYHDRLHYPLITQSSVIAAGNEKPVMLQWLRARECPWDERTCANAACGGHLETLKWARANGCWWDERTCWNAAREGHLEVLQWARANGCPWNDMVCAAAAKGGYLAVLQWAHPNGCPWDVWTCAGAAEGGHLEVLQWARANGCQWNEWTCAWAARGGHLAVLQWAHANGCPWDEATWIMAQGSVRPWLREHGCPGAN